MIREVLKEGPIQIQDRRGLQFGGYWDPNIRAVVMDGRVDPIYTLVFELHNASAQKEFDQLSLLASQGKISRERFIRDFEWIEYQNTFKTSAVVAEGIQKGVFPEESQSWYSSNFEEHLSIQKRAGHSERIGEFYDLLTS
ncbi:MAG: hypothetical protein K1X28_07050 [Parachlamydiales bacterium]|nr:hypothetical protein [Parachlamydiales bacterium]